MPNSNPSETVDKINILNANIREILVEVLPVVSPELQLEITNLFQQTNHINYLINKKKNSWTIGKFKPNNDSIKYTLLLEEIKSILLISKSDKISPIIIQKFRLNLEKEVNSDRYFFWGHILNSLTYIYYIKSVPFKIFLGLSFTTLIAIIVLNFSSKEIYKSDINLNQKPIERKTSFSTTIPRLSTNSEILSAKIPDKLDKTTYPNQHVWYALIYAGTAGVLGSVASILLRIIDFKDQKYDDPLMPFFIGLCKPIIGLILGIFVCSLISSDTFIKIDFLIAQDNNSSSLITSKARQDLFIFSCAFLVGFSERFASDLLKKSESAIIENKS